MKSLKGINGNWEETKGKLKQDFALITDSDLSFKDGRQDELLGRLQAKLGKTREEVLDLLSGI